jgi:hypothetical protein
MGLEQIMAELKIALIKQSAGAKLLLIWIFSGRKP